MMSFSFSQARVFFSFAACLVSGAGDIYQDVVSGVGQAGVGGVFLSAAAVGGGRSAFLAFFLSLVMI